MVWGRRPRVYYAAHAVLKSDRVWYVSMRRREFSGLYTAVKARTILGDGAELAGWLRGAGLPSTVGFDGGEALIRPTGRRGRLRPEGQLIVRILKLHFARHKNRPIYWTWEIRLND